MKRHDIFSGDYMTFPELSEKDLKALHKQCACCTDVRWILPISKDIHNGFCAYISTRSLTFSGSTRTYFLGSIPLLAAVLHGFALGMCCSVGIFVGIPTPLFPSFGVAVLTRQTNIVWAGFSAAIRLFRGIDTSKPFSSLFHSLVSITSFVILALSFIVFVFVNGGIVLGDASAHHPRLHLAQLLYLALFIAIHAWPHALPRVAKLFPQLARPLSILLVVPIALAAQYFGYDHPYLIADNRHVTFYLWRWWQILSTLPSDQVAVVKIIRPGSLLPSLLVAEVIVSSSSARAVKVSPRQPFLFSGGEAKQVKCWDLEYNKVIRHYHGDLISVRALFIHPRLELLISCARDSTARIWDMRTKALVHCSSGHTNTVSDVVTQAPELQLIYPLPDGSRLEIGASRFRAPEVLLRPELIGKPWCSSVRQ